MRYYISFNKTNFTIRNNNKQYIKQIKHKWKINSNRYSSSSAPRGGKRVEGVIAGMDLLESLDPV